jgi:polysaccharide pyruvyl transferase WcaK-like protein/O-antigen/teichoic acid export membrane protein
VNRLLDKAQTTQANLNKAVAPGILLFIDQILVAAGGWIFWLVISKLTPPSEIGIATAFYSLAMLVSTACQLGLEYPLLKRSSADRSRIFGAVITIEAILTLASIPILLYIAGMMYGEQAREEYVWLAAGIFVTSSLGFVSRFALLGVSDAKTVFVFDMVATAMKFAVGFLLVSQGYGGIGILVSFVAYSAIILAGTVAVAKKRLTFGLGSLSYLKEILREGLANTPSKLSKMFITNLSIVLLAFVGATGSADIGVFYIELMISVAAGSMASSMAYMIIPAASASSKANADLAIGGIRIGLSLTAVFVVALLIDPVFVLSLVGPNYAAEGNSFFILCISIIPAAILNSSIAKLNTLNKLKPLVIIGSVQIAAFLPAFFLLSPIYGLTGAAVSVLAAFSLAALLSLVWFHERPYMRAIASSSGAVLAGWLIGYIIQMMTSLQSPYLLIPVSVAVTIGILFATRNISFSDIRLILGAGGKKSRNSDLPSSGKSGDQQRILMLGNYGNFNIGDETLLRAVINDVRKNSGENVIFQIPTRNPHFAQIYHKNDSRFIEPLSIRAPSKIMRAFLNCNMIIVGGGGIWSGYTGPLAHLIPIVTIAGKVLGKRIEFRSIGLYSTASRVDRFLVNLALSLADKSSVRDEESFQQLWNANKKKTVKTDDLAIQYLRGLSQEDASGDKSTLSSIKQNGKLIIGISVKPVNKNETNAKIISEFSAALTSLHSRYHDRLHFVFFPFAKTESKLESDEELTKLIHSRLPSEVAKNVTILEHADPLSWFMTIKECVDVFIGMRFHSIIFASEANKPVLCIPYERKIVEFLRGKPAGANLSSLPPESLESSMIVRFVDEHMKKMVAAKEMQT